MNRQILQSIVGALLVAQVASAQGPAQGTSGRTGTGAEVTGNKATLQQVVNLISQANQSEIRFSQLAVQRAKSQSVKDYAQMVLSDHQQAQQRLQSIAQKQNIQISSIGAGSMSGQGGSGAQVGSMQGSSVGQGGSMQGKYSIPQPVQQAEEAIYTGLESLQGEELDRAFVAVNVMQHDLVVPRLVMAQSELGTGPLVDYIRETLPKLQDHRERGIALLGQLKPSTIKTGKLQ